jgi:hypothetical protein
MPQTIAAVSLEHVLCAAKALILESLQLAAGRSPWSSPAVERADLQPWARRNIVDGEYQAT